MRFAFRCALLIALIALCLAAPVRPAKRADITKREERQTFYSRTTLYYLQDWLQRFKSDGRQKVNMAYTKYLLDYVKGPNRPLRNWHVVMTVNYKNIHYSHLLAQAALDTPDESEALYTADKANDEKIQKILYSLKDLVGSEIGELFHLFPEKFGLVTTMPETTKVREIAKEALARLSRDSNLPAQWMDWPKYIRKLRSDMAHFQIWISINRQIIKQIKDGDGVFAWQLLLLHFDLSHFKELDLLLSVFPQEPNSKFYFSPIPLRARQRTLYDILPAALKDLIKSNTCKNLVDYMKATMIEADDNDSVLSLIERGPLYQEDPDYRAPVEPNVYAIVRDFALQMQERTSLVLLDTEITSLKTALKSYSSFIQMGNAIIEPQGFSLWHLPFLIIATDGRLTSQEQTNLESAFVWFIANTSDHYFHGVLNSPLYIAQSGMPFADFTPDTIELLTSLIHSDHFNSALLENLLDYLNKAVVPPYDVLYQTVQNKF